MAISCNRTITEEKHPGADTIFYQSKAYSIYCNSVVDSIYGGTKNPALIPDDTTIFSPVRIVPAGKTVVLDTSSLWHPVPGIRKYPKLRSRFASVNATYNIALDILYRCSSGEFMRNVGEEGMWQAGFRQGEGYGVWTRRSSRGRRIGLVEAIIPRIQVLLLPVQTPVFSGSD